MPDSHSALGPRRRWIIDVYDARVENYPALLVRLPDGDEFLFVFDKRLKRGARFHFAIFVDESALSHSIHRYPYERRLAWLQETPIKMFSSRISELESKFKHVLTFEDGLIRRGPPFRICLLGTSWINYGRPTLLGSFKKSTLASFVGSVEHPDAHGYALRKEIAQWCIASKWIECWGRGIKPFARKDDILAHSMFSVCMENIDVNYYFTEKLVDCLVTETVPIYWGCPGISSYFDPRGILQFSTLEEFIRVCATLSPERYHGMRPFVLANKKTAFQLGVTGHEGLYRRIAEYLSTEVPFEKGIALGWRSDLAYAARLLFSRLSLGSDHQSTHL